MTHLAQLDRIADVRSQIGEWRDSGPIGLVPTMGALHAGHARLIQEARAECARVVVSIFVNPLQFDRPDDLRLYPRTLEEDAALCGHLGVDVLFVPSMDEMYATQPVCTVDPGHLANHLCGAYRVGHFRGVATVVLKLLNIVAPDRAFFGEKDIQQLAIIRRMAADFDLPVTIVGVPTVREEDGLALSSRNTRLNARERKLAPALHQALVFATELIERGFTDAATIKREAAATIPPDDAVRLEYLEIVDPHEMQPVESVAGAVTIAGAIWIGGTRLIDNVQCAPART